MSWRRNSDDYDDKPYGNPRRAANMRWESRSQKALRRTREGAGSLLSLVTWPLRAAGRALAGLLGGR